MTVSKTVRGRSNRSTPAKSPMYHNLAPETIDGLLYEAELRYRLKCNPKLKARNERYRKAVQLGLDFSKTKSKEYLISVLKWHNPAYIVEILQRHNHSDLSSRFAHTFWKGFETDLCIYAIMDEIAFPKELQKLALPNIRKMPISKLKLMIDEHHERHQKILNY